MTPENSRERVNGYALALVIGVTALCLSGYVTNNVITPYYYASNNDFKHLYLGAAATSMGQNPYDEKVLGLLAERSGLERLNPFVYPPFAGIALLPLSWFSFPAAARVWQACNHVFLLASLFLIARALSRGRTGAGCLIVQMPILAIGCAVLASHPVYRTVSAGQLNALLLVLISGAFYAESRKKTAVSGALLALAAMIKVTPGLLILHYVIRRDWRAVASFGIACIVLMIVSLSLVEARTHIAFLPLLREMGYGSSTWASHGEAFYSDAFNQAPSALWYRLFTDQTLNRVGTAPLANLPALAKAMSWITGLGILGLTAWLSWRMSSERKSWKDSFSLWLFPMLLCPSLMWDHYLILLLPSVAVLLLSVEVPGRWRRLLLSGIGLAMILPYFPLDSAALRSGAGLLLISWKTCGALLIFAAAIASARGSWSTGRLIHE